MGPGAYDRVRESGGLPVLIPRAYEASDLFRVPVRFVSVFSGTMIS